MGLASAIKNRDIKELETTVNAAVEIYKQELPDEAKSMVNTVHGDMPISMIFDEDTKWNVITGEYVAITNKVKALPKGCDEQIETAKIIANSAILRHVVEGKTTGSGLL